MAYKYIEINVVHQNALILEEFKVHTLDRVSKVKDRIAEKVGLEYPANLVLHYNGRVLSDSLKLDHCGVTEGGSCLILTLAHNTPEDIADGIMNKPITTTNTRFSTEPSYPSSEPSSPATLIGYQSPSSNPIPYVSPYSHQSPTNRQSPAKAAPKEETSHDRKMGIPESFQRAVDSGHFAPYHSSSGESVFPYDLPSHFSPHSHSHQLHPDPQTAATTAANQGTLQDEETSIKNLQRGIELGLRINAAVHLGMSVNTYYETLQASVGRQLQDGGENGEVLKAEEALKAAWGVMEGNFVERKEAKEGLFIEW